MLDISLYCILAGTIAVVVALMTYVLVFATARLARTPTTLAVEGATGEIVASSSERATSSVAGFGTLTAWLALLFLSAALVFRGVAVGHGPFANMYEFSIAFAWGALVINSYFYMRYRQWGVGLIVLPVALGMILYADTVSSSVEPLVPALQNNLLLTLHVATAVIAYGAFAVGFAAAVLYMVQAREERELLPKRELLDHISYRATLVGFPFLTLTIILGAVWANIAWGKYWSWDPKETASLVTWLVCGAYLHARAARGWRGRRAAVLLMFVFAAVLLCYFGNLFFGGLHSYG